MYLLDHADREDIESRNPKKEDGFNCRLKFSTDNYTDTDINDIKTEIENGNIRDQKSFNSWAKAHINQQRRDNSNRIVAEVRGTNGNNDNLHSRPSEGESFRGRNNTSSPEDFGTGFIRVYVNDGTNGPRYISINDNANQQFITPQGIVYGFATPDGRIYLDRRIIRPEHPIHEYTHLWDRAVIKNNRPLWNKGVALMKQLDLWNEVLNDKNYGKKWQKDGITGRKLTDLIASEVHSRLVGRQGQAMLKSIASKKDKEGIIGKLKQWLLDVWKEVAQTFGVWTKEDLENLTLDDFLNMTIRDFVNGLNPNKIINQALDNTTQYAVDSAVNGTDSEVFKTKASLIKMP